eukprot:1037664-Pelagomonas_calceolata.AAC.8
MRLQGTNRHSLGDKARLAKMSSSAHQCIGFISIVLLLLLLHDNVQRVRQPRVKQSHVGQSGWPTVLARRQASWMSDHESVVWLFAR